jgi:signal transduction histidine kinase
MKILWRSLLYLATALVTGTLGFGLLLAGWLAVGLLSLTPLLVPVLIGFRFLVGALAELERRLARALLGVDPGPQPRTSGGAGYWGRTGAVLADRTFWRQHGFVLLRTLVGWPLAVGAVSLVASALWLVGLPIYYRFVDQSFGFFRVDTLGDALLVVPVGIAGLFVALLVVHGASRAWQAATLPLLAPAERRRRRLLVPHLVTTAVSDAVVLIVWAAVGGSFWPGWVLASTALPLGVHAWVELSPRRDALTVVGGVFALVEAYLVVLWGFAGGGTLWPVWPALGLAIAFVILALALRQRRIAVLETTRAGAVDVQDTELRRIERDLHDGAQARLVALGMSLGMAEQKLTGDPSAAAALVAEARTGVEEALRELRDLARGIHPPVLTDRGLEAALAALTDRSTVPVRVEAELAERPPAAVETAAYFVAAEAIANAGKHAGASHIDVRLARTPGALLVEVSDDGRGGAVAAGAGLTGLRRRVEALDGILEIVSPLGGGTTLRAELPCAS